MQKWVRFPLFSTQIIQKLRKSVKMEFCVGSQLSSVNMRLGDVITSTINTYSSLSLSLSSSNSHFPSHSPLTVIFPSLYSSFGIRNLNHHHHPHHMTNLTSYAYFLRSHSLPRSPQALETKRNPVIHP